MKNRQILTRSREEWNEIESKKTLKENVGHVTGSYPTNKRIPGRP
jgi:hypothetical protein